MHHQMRRLKVRALYTAIPEKLEVSVAKLGLGKSLKVGDLSYEGLQLINPKDAVVCSVKTTRNAVDATTTDEDAAATEGEAAPEAAPAE
jgi:large subunit ribosomal protein L25